MSETIAAGTYSFAHIQKDFGKQRVLVDASAELPPGSLVGILGLNGTGKTTLMNILGNVDRDFAGMVSLRGNDVAYMRVRLPFPEYWPVKEVLAFYRDFYRFDEERARRMLGRVLISEHMRLRNMSSGQQRQVNFIVNFCVEARVLLLDEPLTNLDLNFRETITESLIDRAMSDRIIIVTTHEIKEFENLFTHVAVLKNGFLGTLTEAEEIRASGRSIADFYREEVQ